MVIGVVTSQDNAPFSLACSIALCLGKGSLDFSVLAFVKFSKCGFPLSLLQLDMGGIVMVLVIEKVNKRSCQ